MPDHGIAFGGLSPLAATVAAVALCVVGIGAAIALGLLAWKLLVPPGTFRRWRERRRVARLARGSGVDAYIDELRKQREARVDRG